MSRNFRNTRIQRKSASSRRNRRSSDSRPERDLNVPVVDRSLLVMGRNSVQEVARVSPERISRLYLSSVLADEIKSGQWGPDLKSLLGRGGAGVLSSEQLTALVGSDSHQGMIAQLLPRPKREWADVLRDCVEAGTSILIVALDGITDPHNLGAVLRAAECFGIDAVVWSKNRGSGITPVVSKVSVGASELVTCVEVSNLAEALRRAQTAGFWVVAADGGEASEALEAFRFPERSILVLGAEGHGVSRLLLDRSDFRVRISMSGRIDSLNVSQAAAVLLFWARRGSSPTHG